MNTVKILSLMSVLLFFNSCSLTVDVDEEDERGRIAVSALGNNSNGSVSIGGYLDLEVRVFDRDGVASVRIEIPAINVDFLTQINSSESTQKINQTFNVNEVDSNESKTIFVTLTDKEGNSYTKTIAFATE